MERLNIAGRIFYGIAIAATGIQQFFFHDFFQILFPPVPFTIPGVYYFSRLVAFILVIAGLAIIMNIKTGFFASALGFLFLFLFIFCQVPYELFISPYSPIHLGLWINPLKESAYAGGAFVIAGQSAVNINQRLKLIERGRRFAPIGAFLFSFTMISFGLSHFYYADTVADLVPGWIPAHFFWTYFAAIALIGSGIAIIIRFRVYFISNLLGLMIFLWFIILHIPRALAAPLANNGNEVTSAFSALAFSGIALVIANSQRSPVVGKLSPTFFSRPFSGK
jgi:uncharacterized membrane protein